MKKRRILKKWWNAFGAHLSRRDDYLLNRMASICRNEIGGVDTERYFKKAKMK